MRIAIRDKTFPPLAASPARPVLRDVCIELRRGERVMLFGPSGCGKTTTLNIAAGLDRAFAGKVDLAGARIGYVFQEPRLLPWLSALDNVRLPLTRGQDSRTRAQRWLEAMGVGDAADVYPNRLSLGMARRVAMARAFAVQPDLLILDEPFASLDAALAVRLRHLLLDTLAAQGAALLGVSHDLDEAVMLADRLIVLGGVPATIAHDLAIALDAGQRRDAQAVRARAAELRAVMCR
ncbi:MAG: ABC transporter ATP-binding protein [Geminicoccaceae bacterium]